MAGKSRSPNFPRIPLGASLEFLEKFYLEAKRTPVASLNAAQAMGYKTLNGQSMGILGALRGYGLLEGKKEAVKVSELGFRILRKKSDSDRAAAINEALNLPSLFAQIKEELGDLSEKALTAQLLHKDFTEDGAARAAGVFHANSEFAKLESGRYSGDETPDSDDDKIVEKPEEDSVKKRPPHKQSPTENVLATYNIPLGRNEAQLTFTGEALEPDDFDALIDYVELFKRQFERKSRTERDETMDAADEALEATFGE